ncbi:MAG: hypothetical protein U0P81_03030 [Holophagaceae bacterium]
MMSVYGQMGSLSKQRPQPNIIWGESNLAIIQGNGTRVQQGEIPQGPLKEIHLPSGTIGASIRNGVISVVRLLKTDFMYYKRNPAGLIEEYPIEIDVDGGQRGYPSYIYETDQPGVFFAINVETGFVKDGEASCCAWYRKTERNSLTLSSLIPIDWEGPTYLPTRQNGKPFISQRSSFRPGLFPFLDYPIRVPGAFIVVSWKAGILWVVKDGDPFPFKTIDLIGIDREFVIGKHPFPPVILCVQPMRNGHLLIARRTASAISETYKHYGVAPIGEALRDAEYSFAAKERDTATNAYSEIEWEELDPLEGSRQKADLFMISKAPLRLKDEKDATSYIFGFDLQERLIIPWKGSVEMDMHKTGLNVENNNTNLNQVVTPAKVKSTNGANKKEVVPD